MSARSSTSTLVAMESEIIDSDENQNESQVILNTDFERMSFTKELLGIQNMWSDAPVDDNPNPSPFATKLQSNHDSSQFGESTGWP